MQEILVLTLAYARLLARTDCWGEGGEVGQPLGTGVFWQFSLAGNSVAALHLVTCDFLVGNHTSEEHRDIDLRPPEKSQ